MGKGTEAGEHRGGEYLGVRGLGDELFGAGFNEEVGDLIGSDEAVERRTLPLPILCAEVRAEFFEGGFAFDPGPGRGFLEGIVSSIQFADFGEDAKSAGSSLRVYLDG